MDNVIKKNDQRKIVIPLAQRDKDVIYILEGKAPRQYNPDRVDISGTITAPSRFLEVRKGEFYPKSAYCKASKTDGTLKLIMNEQDTCNRYTISGKIEIGKKFVQLGINEDVNYSPLKLAKKLKLLRSIFPSNSEHSIITSSLRNIKAKVNRIFEESTDDRANKSTLFKQTVESNMPEHFKLKLPLLEGEEAEIIEVAVILEADGSYDIQCYLESVEGAEKIDLAKEKLVNEEVKKIEKDVLVIFH